MQSHDNAALQLIAEILALKFIQAAREHGSTGDEDYRESGLYDEKAGASER